MNSNPEKINEAIPNPRVINKSLTQAPSLLSQFSAFTVLVDNSVSVL